MSKEIKYYPCYSDKQMEFLKSKGMNYLLRCRHWTTNKATWIFIWNEELDKFLKEWSNNSPSN